MLRELSVQEALTPLIPTIDFVAVPTFIMGMPKETEAGLEESKTLVPAF
jgi:hypothetical protein